MAGSTGQVLAGNFILAEDVQAELDAITTRVTLLDDPPRANIKRTTAQTIANSAYAIVAFNAADGYDTASGHDIVTNNSRYTVQTGHGGLWTLSGNASWTANATGNRAFQWYVNGAAVQALVLPAAAAANGGQHPGPTIDIDLVAGDYVEVGVFQASGGNLDMTACSAWLRRICD